MEDPKGKMPPELGASPRKPRKKKEDPAPVMTPSKLRAVIKPSSRGNGDFAASATRRRGENLEKQGQIGALSGGISDQPQTTQGHQLNYSEVSTRFIFEVTFTDKQNVSVHTRMSMEKMVSLFLTIRTAPCSCLTISKK